MNGCWRCELPNPPGRHVTPRIGGVYLLGDHQFLVLSGTRCSFHSHQIRVTAEEVAATNALRFPAGHDGEYACPNRRMRYVHVLFLSHPTQIAAIPITYPHFLRSTFLYQCFDQDPVLAILWASRLTSREVSEWVRYPNAVGPIRERYARRARQYNNRVIRSRLAMHVSLCMIKECKKPVTRLAPLRGKILDVPVTIEARLCTHDYEEIYGLRPLPSISCKVTV